MDRNGEDHSPNRSRVDLSDEIAESGARKDLDDHAAEDDQLMSGSQLQALLDVASDGKQIGSEQAFQSSLVKWSMRKIALQNQLEEERMKKANLRELYESQQQTLLEAQMNLEELSNEYDAEIKVREVVDCRMLQYAAVVKSFQDHAASVDEALLKLSNCKENLQDKEEQSLNFLIQLREEGKRLQQEIQENYKNFQRDGKAMDRAYDSAYQNFRKTCDDLKDKNDGVTARLKEELLEQESIKQNLEVQLKSLREKKEACLKSEMENDLHHKKTLEALTKEAEEQLIPRNKNLEHTLDLVNQDNSNLKSQIRSETDRCKEINEAICSLETESKELERKRGEMKESLDGSKLNIECLQRSLKELQDQCLQLTELKEELRTTLESKKLENSKRVFEARMEVEQSSSEVIARASMILQEIEEVKLDLTERDRRIKDRTQELANVKSEIERLRQVREQAVSESDSFQTQWKEKSEEKLKLLRELEDMSKMEKAHNQQRSDLKELLNQQNNKFEETLRTHNEQRENMMKEILQAKKNLESGKSKNASLSQKICQLKEQSSKLVKSTQKKHNEKVHYFEEQIAMLERKKHELNSKMKNSLVQEDEFNLKEKQLEEKEKTLSSMNDEYESLVEELNCQRQTLNNINTDTAEKEAVVQRLSEEALLLEDLLKANVSKVSEKTKDLEERQKKLHTQQCKILELKLLVEKSEEMKDRTMDENKKQMEALINDISDSKKSSESAATELSQLQKEINSWKRDHATAQAEVGHYQNLISDQAESFNKNTAIVEASDKQLKNLTTELRNASSKLKNLRLEQEAANKKYQQLRKYVMKAKSKRNQEKENESRDPSNSKKHYTSSSGSAGVTPDKQSAPSTNFKSATPQKDVKKAPFLTGASAAGGAPEQNVTPKSILKSSKPSTPVLEVKRVSFAEQYEDLASSSSSVDVNINHMS